MLALSEIKARDLMQSDLVTLPSDATIEEAIATFEEYDVSGIPVLGPGSDLVGIITEADVARTGHVRHDRVETVQGEYDYASGDDEEPPTPTQEDEEIQITSKEDYSPQLLGRQTVQDWMTPTVVTLPPDAGLGEVCRTLVREAIHRVVIVEGDNRPVGIVSTTDVVRVLAERL